MTGGLSRIREDERSALKELTRDFRQAEVPRIPEHLFVNKYLPILTFNLGKETPVEIRLNSLWVSEVAGHHYSIVNVHTDNDPSEILFWVPPLLRQTPFLKEGARGVSFAEEVQTAAKQSAIIPAMGFNYMREVVNERMPEVDLTEDQQQWLMILKRYNLLPEEIEVTGDVAGGNVTNAVVYGEMNEF